MCRPSMKMMLASGIVAKYSALRVYDYNQFQVHVNFYSGSLLRIRRSGYRRGRSRCQVKKTPEGSIFRYQFRVRSAITTILA